MLSGQFLELQNSMSSDPIHTKVVRAALGLNEGQLDRYVDATVSYMQCGDIKIPVCIEVPAAGQERYLTLPNSENFFLRTSTATFSSGAFVMAFYAVSGVQPYTLQLRYYGGRNDYSFCIQGANTGIWKGPVYLAPAADNSAMSVLTTLRGWMDYFQYYCSLTVNTVSINADTGVVTKGSSQSMSMVNDGTTKTYPVMNSWSDFDMRRFYSSRS